MIKELKERLTILQDRLDKVNKDFEEHADNDKRILNDKYFTKYDILIKRQIKLEKQVSKVENLIKDLEFIFED